MLKEYTPKYLMENRGSYTEAHVKQLIGDRQNVTFAEIWASSQLPVHEKLFFLVKLASLKNDEKIRVAIELAKIARDVLEDYDDGDPEARSRPDTQPSLIPSYDRALEIAEGIFSDPGTYAPLLPVALKNAAIASTIYLYYYGTTIYSNAIKAIETPLRMLDASNYLPEINEATEFLDNAAYSSTYSLSQLADIELDGTTVEATILTNVGALVDDFTVNSDAPPEEPAP